MENIQTEPRRLILQDLWSELASVSLYLSEIIWVSAIYCILFNRPFEVLKIGLATGILGFIGYFLTRFLFSRKLSKKLIFSFISAWILAALLIFIKWIIFEGSSLTFSKVIIEPFITLISQPTLQSHLWQMIVAVMLFQRGFTLGSCSPHTWRTIKSFQVGMLMFLFYGLTTAWDHILKNLIPFLAYLFVILIAMNTARLSELENAQNSRTPAFKKSWLLGMIGLAIGTVVLGSGMGWLLGITFVNFSTSVINVLYGIVIVFLIIVFAPLIGLIALLMPWLSNLISKLINGKFGVEQLSFLQQLNQLDPERAARVANTLNQTVIIVLVVLLMIIIIAAIFGIRNRRRKTYPKLTEEAMQLISDRKTRKLTYSPRFLQSRLDQALRWLAAARIRRIYQQLMGYCLKLDNPRLPAFTPLEFLPQLIHLFPEYPDQLTLLTETYLRVRYGEVPETLEEMKMIVLAWSGIKTNAETRIRERKSKLMKK
jgi:hypothetical protein